MPDSPSPSDSNASFVPNVVIDNEPGYGGGGGAVDQRSASERFEEAMDDGYMEVWQHTIRGMDRSIGW